MADVVGLRATLKKKMGLGSEALRKRVERFGAAHGIAPREHALYVFALDNGVGLTAYGVDAETQRRASDLLRSIRATDAVKGSPATPAPIRRRSTVKTINLEAGSVNLGALPDLLSGFVSQADERSASAYRILYLVENAVRETIRRVLAREHGKDRWWSAGVDASIQKSAARRREQDEDDPWHEPRGDHDIHYIDLHHNAGIITSPANWPTFEPIFKRVSFVTGSSPEAPVNVAALAHATAVSSF